MKATQPRDKDGEAGGTDPLEKVDQAEGHSAHRPVQPDEPLPIRMLHDRVLVMLDNESAERRSAGGILIPATAAVGRRLSWAYVVATGQHVRQVSFLDRVLFDPEERAEVEIAGQDYTLLRERDIHAVAENGLDAESAGLYL